MEHRTLGGSGAAVSTYALGTMTFGVETDEAGGHDQLDVFVEAGGTLVDTAPDLIAGETAGSQPAGARRARRYRSTSSSTVVASSGALSSR